MTKNVQTTTQLCSFHMLARQCSKSFKISFNNKKTEKFQMYMCKLGLEKQRNQKSNSQHLLNYRKSKGIPEKKKSIPASFAMLKVLTVWITTNCGNFIKRWEYQTTLPASWKACAQVKTQHLELDMEQQTDSKLGKEYIKAIYCHLVYITFMQSTSFEILSWINNKLEKGLSGKTATTSDMQMIQL